MHAPLSMQSHDTLFRSLMAEEGVVDALLRERLPPPLVRAFAGKPERLPEHFVDPTLKAHIADQVVRVPLKGGTSAFVYCLLEHKRTADALVLVQILRYLSLLYAELAKAKPRAQLPPVIPLLVYNGTARWPGPTRFSELVAAPRSVRHLLLDFGVVLIDVGAEPVTKLSANPALLGGLLAMKASAGPRRREAALIRAALKTGPVDRSTWTMLFRYLESVSRDEGRRALQRIGTSEGKGTVPTLEQILKDMGRRNGIRVGERRGLKKGRAEGREEAAEALRPALVALLTERFGSLPVRVRRVVAQADFTALTGWITKAGAARSANELLGLPSPRKPPRSAARA